MPGFGKGVDREVLQGAIGSPLACQLAVRGVLGQMVWPKHISLVQFELRRVFLYGGASEVARVVKLSAACEHFTFCHLLPPR